MNPTRFTAGSKTMTMAGMPPTPSVPSRPPIRSFVTRNGRITAGQERALQSLWPRFGLAFEPGTLSLEQAFGRQAPCTMEIGFGNGEHLLARALAAPERNFLGVEVHRAGVGHLLLAIEQAGIGNLRVICHDAVEVLQQQLAPGALDEVFLLFPDPWPKLRHHKRRIVQDTFVQLVASRLRSGGRFYLATDWEPYAAHMLEVLGRCTLLCNDTPGGGFAPRPGTRAATRFERRGARLGHAVYDLAFHRR
jgi:tRNA (guanine-N7-)-methyltransferase